MVLVPLSHNMDSCKGEARESDIWATAGFNMVSQ